MTHPLDAVVDSAIERALADDADARRYFALAGALDRARRPDTDGSPRAAGARPSDHASETSAAGATEVLGAMLTSTAAVRALGSSTTADGIDLDAWSAGVGASDADLVAAGAAAACRRFDVDPERVAAHSGVRRDRILPRTGER